MNVLALVIATLILPTHTPGARYSKVTQGTIKTTICVKGWTATIRPPSSYTSALKRVQLVVWQYADTNQAHYEEDHLISLELGGAPRSKKNLWPQPWPQARRDDHGIRSPPPPAGQQRHADAQAGTGRRGRLQAQVRMTSEQISPN